MFVLYSYRFGKLHWQNGGKIEGRRKSSGKSVGGKKGHKGHTLEMTDKPYHVIVYLVTKYETCGRSLCDAKAISYERRQVFDLLPIKVEAFEHQAERKICLNCYWLNKASFPKKLHILFNMELVYNQLIIKTFIQDQVKIEYVLNKRDARCNLLKLFENLNHYSRQGSRETRSL